MRPTSLAVRGLKCWTDKTLELGQFTAIQGPNGSGKSALIQAIKIALLGHDPDTGKKLDDTRKLISPEAVKETAEVGLSFDNGFGIRRLFGAKMKTQVLPSRGEKTGALCQQRINEETGGLVVGLDLATFFDLSAEKRRAWLLEHIPTDEGVLDWDKFAKWADDEGALGDVVKNLWEHNVKTAPNAVVGLSSAIETARREFLEVDSGRQNQVQVVDRGAEVLRTEEPPEPVEDGRRQEIEERLASTNQRIGEARAGREARETIEKRIGDAAEKRSRTHGEIEHTEHIRKDLLAQLEGMAEPDPTDRSLELHLLEDELEELTENHATRSTVATAARSAVTILERERAKVEKHGPCPYAALGCEQDTSTMLEHVLGGLDQELLIARDMVDTETSAERESAAIIQEAREEAARIRIGITTIGNLTRARQELEQSIEAKASVLRELEDRVDIHAGALTTAEGELDALGSDDALAALYEARDTLVLDRTALQGRLEGIVRHSERVAALEREEAELEYRTGRATALKELDGNLRRLRGHVIQTMIRPLETEAQEILHAVDPSKLFRFYFERGNAATLELGFEEDGVVRLFDAASKGERVMMTVAFLGALLAVIKPAMRLLVIDDIEQLDVTRRANLMEGLVRLSDRWDSCIVAGACSLGGIEGWDLVTLNDTVSAAA